LFANSLFCPICHSKIIFFVTYGWEKSLLQYLEPRRGYSVIIESLLTTGKNKKFEKKAVEKKLKLLGSGVLSVISVSLWPILNSFHSRWTLPLDLFWTLVQID